MRTFQFSDSKSHKFWNIDVQGDSFTVTYGKVGTAGQSTTKTFASDTKAQSEADKLIREKTGKGYVETTPKAVVSDNEAFERAILADPHSISPWAAYADYLTERGDPRGEFMAVQIALEDESQTPAARKSLASREKALLKAHEREWLGPLAAFTVDAEKVTRYLGGVRSEGPPVEHRFSRGWLTRLEFPSLTVRQARALTATSAARLLQELVVHLLEAEEDPPFEPGPDVPEDIDPYDGPGLHSLCRCPYLPSVRVFQLGESVTNSDGQDEEYMNCHTRGEQAYHVVKQMPAIEELYLLAHRVEASKLFALPMPNLRVLQLYHSVDYPLDRLAANASLANLTSIRCHPHALEYDDAENGAYIRLPHLRAICRSPHLKKLTQLALRLTDFGDRGADEIVSSGILERLRVLDLQSGCITDAGAKVLAASPAIEKLEFLNLRSNALGSGAEALFGAVGVKVDVSHQHPSTGPSGDDDMPEYLSEGDIE